MRRLFRYRPGQSVLIVALSALVTGCAVFAPLYDRAVQQAVLLTRLAHTPVEVSGLNLTSRGNGPTAGALEPAALTALVPHPISSALQPPVASTSVQLRTLHGGSRVGSLLWREDACRHLRLSSGRCPSIAGEIDVSAADSRNYGWHVGSRIGVQEVLSDLLLDKTRVGPRPVLRVVGVYRLRPGPYWYGAPEVGRSGTPDPDTRQPQHDDWLSTLSTLKGSGAPQWRDRVTQVDLALDRRRAGVDVIGRIGPEVARFSVVPRPVRPGEDAYGPRASVVAYSGLADIAAAVARGRSQARVTIPLLMVQLGLLAVVVLWLVLGSATDQRRPEVAITRLRGRGVRGARRLLITELGTLVLTGVPLGVAAGVGASSLARHTLLPLRPPLELGLGFLLATAAAILVLVGLVLAAAERTARAPVVDLLRRVPPRHVGWRLGAAEIVLVAAAAAVVVAFATGGLSGPVALAAPALLALVVGLLAAHVVVALASGRGRRLLAHGRVAAGVGALQIARSPSTRRVLALVTVAAALLIFSADAWSVGNRNRASAADQQVGAPVVLSVATGDLVALRSTLHAADPTGTTVTPVVRMSPPGAGGATTVAVLPGEFARVARWPGGMPSAAALDRLDQHLLPPPRLHGRTISVRVRASIDRVDGRPAGRLRPVRLGITVLGADGAAVQVPLGDLPSTSHKARPMRGELPCARGCDLVALTLDASPLHPLRGSVRLSAATTSTGQRVGLGGDRHWVARRLGADQQVAPSRGRPDGLDLRFAVSGPPTLVFTHASVPRRVRALVTGSPVAGSAGASFDGVGLDGISRPLLRVGALPRIPGAPRDADLVDLAVLARDGAAPDPQAEVEVWLARDDPALVGRVTTALDRRGIETTATTRVSMVRRAYDKSAAAWSLQLAVLVGAVGLVLAALVLLVLAASTWRLRTRDLAGLRMAGVDTPTLRSVELIEQVPVVGVAVLLGAACGVLGAHLALPMVPLFASAPSVSTLDLSTSWPAVAVATLLALLVLGTTAALAAVVVSRRAGLHRLRESQ